MNRENPGAENAQVFPGLANCAKPDKANENPGATAIATGAKDVVEGVCSLPEYTALFPLLAMHWGALV
ncbi:hypothetical protein [uncultured Thiohalocapsa sp.]|uniref:hypothetical protein n=1 Tax=uncultured Thiohalocapsa sp. TaxID=768990 RepID=UPI0025EB6CA4|nr:hypothetical protein [uncultured Thiohalocapsa sp.]